MSQASPFSTDAEESDERGPFSRSPADGRVLQWASDSCRDGLVITACPVDGHSPPIAYCNPAFLAFVDEESQQAIRRGGPLVNTDAFPAAHPIWRSIRESYQTTEVFSAEFELRRNHDKTRILRFESDPLRSASGKITHRAAQLRDVTVQASLEESLRSNKRLASIGLLAAGIAHEINNPAGSALLAAETALAVVNSPNANEQITACLRNIVTSMDRCGRIVRTLLRYSREEPTERQACNINDVAKQSLELALPYAERHSVALQLELAPTVPLAPMNPLEIELVLVNLIRNSVEASLGMEHRTVFLQTAGTESGVRVTVSDDGCGMTSEQLHHVFDPLYTTRRKDGGSGLGMSIAYEIVQGHNGHMEVQSKKGKGTTVTLELPLATNSPQLSAAAVSPYNPKEA